MSSDNDSKPFLPKSLKEWLEVLKILAPVVVATAAFLVGFWKVTEGEVLVNTRLLLALSALTPMGFVLLGFYSFRRLHKLNAHENKTPKALKLEDEEEEILKLFVSHDTTALGPNWVADQVKFTPFRFQHHWHQLFGVHHFLDRVKDEDGEDGYMLSHAGRKYVADNGLDR
jgi:hypothetical protein